MQWIVGKDEANQKLVSFLKSKLSDYSAKQIKQSIENNLAQVNGRVEHFASFIVVEKDKISFNPPKIHSEKKTFKFSIEDILYEDEFLLVYNKPAGVSSDGDSFLCAIKKYNKDLELLHRLDKETTGLLMFTKDENFRHHMVDLFKRHKIEKEYLAIVKGSPIKMFGKIDNYLEKVQSTHGQSLYGSSKNASGLRAITHFEVVKKGKNASLVTCFPKTGRTHQIRVHMSEMGNAIYGDKLYGINLKAHISVKRCLLHAYKLRFVHPHTKNQVEFVAEIPADFKQALKDLF